MILYISNATDYGIYNDLFSKDQIHPGYQVQKFNNNIIRGLSQFDSVVALSALHFKVGHERIDETIDNVRYVCIQNRQGTLHKFWNIFGLYSEGVKIVRANRPRYVLCDAISSSPCFVSQLLAKRFGIPQIGIITDLPGMLGSNKDPNLGIGRLQKFDGYILLTEQMNEYVNPRQKPYMIMEGLCAPNIQHEKTKKAEPRIIMYTGSLWKNNAGIEYFTEGFIKANLPNCELHFYGTGEQVEWLEQISKMHSQVKYKGCVSNEEIVRLQKEATLLVNPRPSKEEFCKFSFPSKTIEYMASGTPVLMTRLPGVPSTYFDYVYTIDNENDNGVCDILQSIFSQKMDSLVEKGNNAAKFVINNKSCIAQTQAMNNFCLQICNMIKENK